MGCNYYTGEFKKNIDKNKKAEKFLGVSSPNFPALSAY
jgi:hypothetical protein